jgi:transposase
MNKSLSHQPLDSEVLYAREVLDSYLSQQNVERDFRFVIDPMFFTQSIFIKTPKRVAALTMVMGFWMLIYNLYERKLHLRLAAARTSIPDQRGKLTIMPTLR